MTANELWTEIPRCMSCRWFVITATHPPLTIPRFEGLCWRHPQWAKVDESHYCGEHRPKDDPILNPKEP